MRKITALLFFGAQLHLEYFPTNLKLKDGTIKEAWFGYASDKEGFLKRINLYRR